jgi:hypothetical protein
MNQAICAFLQERYRFLRKTNVERELRKKEKKNRHIHICIDSISKKKGGMKECKEASNFCISAERYRFLRGWVL